MREIVDALTMSIVLLMVPWLIVQIGGGMALSNRLGVPPWVGLLAGVVPVPFAGWLIVVAVGAYQARGGNGGGDFDTSPIDPEQGLIDW